MMNVQPVMMKPGVWLLFLSSCLMVTTSCATAKNDDLPLPMPASTAAADARMVEMQKSMTELLERLDVVSERMQRLESVVAEQRSLAAEQRSAASQPAPLAAIPMPVTVSSVAAAPVPTPAPEAQPSRLMSRTLLAAQVADNYRNALMLYGKGRAQEARKAFQEIFDADPAGDLADNALFWIGETWFAAGDYASAVKYYKRVVTEFSEQNKAPDALYKIGVASEKTSDLAQARSTFEEVIRKYPYSSAAASAKLEMKRISY